MLKIAFDAQLLFEKQKTGIGWNSKMLIDELIQNPDNEYQLNCFNFKKDAECKRILDDYRKKGCIINECRWIPSSVYNHLERWIPFPYRFIFGSGSDITQFFNYTLPFGVKGKQFTIVHDMSYKAYPQSVAKRTKRWLDRNLEKYCKRADVIITVSEFSKGEIMKYLSIPSEKIEVVYNGVDLNKYRICRDHAKVNSTRKKYNIDGDYILYLGTLEPRKNIEGLLKAYMYLGKEEKNIPKLVIAGKKGWMYDSIFEFIKEHDLQRDVIFPGYIAEEDTAVLISGAVMFVFPSFYEGFGIPPLEAMACGTPVITSNCSSLPEIVGDAGILINPDDIMELKQGMQKLLSNIELREELRKKGLARAKEFSWKASAEKLMDIYNKIKMETPYADN